MTLLWKTGIPKRIYARLYCSWRRVKREVELLKEIFSKFNAKNLVEFGCGLGRHGYLLSKMGFNVVLTDAVDWRYGVARKLPFVKLDVLDDNSTLEGVFDGGYAVNFLTIFKYKDMVKALKNIGRIIGKGVFVADYNFTLYKEPRVVYVKVGGETYKAVLEKEKRTPIEDGGMLYSYRVKVLDKHGNVVGVEEDSYPVYGKDVVFRAIKEAGFRIADLVWVTWDPVKYVYKFTGKRESDSAFIVMVNY
ncbi:MAG: hypothetical protein QXE77_05705 [Desulfurococcaceae archaeon]